MFSIHKKKAMVSILYDFKLKKTVLSYMVETRFSITASYMMCSRG